MVESVDKRGEGDETAGSADASASHVLTPAASKIMKRDAMSETTTATFGTATASTPEMRIGSESDIAPPLEPSTAAPEPSAPYEDVLPVPSSPIGETHDTPRANAAWPGAPALPPSPSREPEEAPESLLSSLSARIPVVEPAAITPRLDTPAASEETHSGALVIPFVPRDGFVRPVVPQVQSEARFARPTGPAAYAAGTDAPPAILPPAQPPPPSGFRRAPGWVRPEIEPAVSPVAQSEPPLAPRISLGNRLATLRQGWRWGRVLRVGLAVIAGLILAYTLFVLGLVMAYRWINPPMSSLMLSQRMAGTEISQRWMPIERISPHLVQAVVLSEDGQFCRHHGVDWLAMREAIEQSLDGSARGGSTISMQTVKNLFLWPSKSYVRKAIEIPLAMGTEVAWPKARMLEIYLNIAEWGPGVFGAEAAARYHFGKSAANLSAREASLLAVSLPNPFDRQAGQPGIGTQRLAERLQARMRRVPNAAACGLPSQVQSRRELR